MRLISRFIAQILINALALLAIFYLVPEAKFIGDWTKLLEIALVLGIINFLVKPLLKLFLGPLVVLTLGLFSLVINALILWIVVQLFPNVLIIPWGWPLVWATIIVSVINFVFHFLSKSKA
ncbi:MAG TPA: phage holin family protein [Candidatus Paceibacterota bacterium]|nr:phage holin family protein [Candidatus Paceibacterota bacterium]